MQTDKMCNIKNNEQLELLKAIYIHSGINKEQIKKAGEALGLSEHDVHVIFGMALNQLEWNQSMEIMSAAEGVTIH
jgi:hypothetical protein